MNLWAGFDKYLEAIETGNTNIEARIFYPIEFLKKQNFTEERVEFEGDVNESPRGFYKVLAELVGDIEEMYSRYPINIHPVNGKYFRLILRDTNNPES